MVVERRSRGASESAIVGAVLIAFDMRLFKAAKAGLSALQGSIPKLISIGRELGLEVVGFVYWVFAALFIFSPFGFIEAYRSLPDSFVRVLISGAGALMWAWFGYTSFRRAKSYARARAR